MTDSELRPIRRLLVANRGEIARRVFRTAHSMGISTVAVYAEGDAEAPFVTDADLSVPLGGRTAVDSYLSIDKVIAAAENSAADAVHPGYGFLSENADFAQAVIDAGLIWVGPAPTAIAAMGDKLAAKESMTAAGVPTLPSVPVADSMSGDDLIAAGAEVGYPLLVKASAGGGGKGMRIVDAADTLADAVAAARREAAGAFGDDTVFLERYLPAPRHVEIQVLGDTHGNLVHCFERECSIQRRHQKVIEEAPSPAVTPALRDRMGAAAVAAVRTIGYHSAGTVEFLLEGSGDDAEFWFLEVNTRLQVEHPVTEEITGLDLVREQIRVAAGEPLGYGQDDLTIRGHATEARLYAEDPASGFLPATGTVELWAPARDPQARFDSGIEVGSVVGTEFDPMLAKVVMAAPTRTEAALGLASALDRTRLGGVVTNRDFLSAVLRSDEFLAGDTTTDFIERTGLASDSPPYRGQFLHAAASAVALVSQARNRSQATALSFMSSGYRNSVMPDEVLPLTALDPSAGDADVSVTYRRQRDGSYRLRVAPLRADAPYAPPDDSDAPSGDHDHRDGGVPEASEFVVRPHSIQIHAIADDHIRIDAGGGATDAPPAEKFDAELDVETGSMRGTWQVSRRGHNWYVTGPLTGSATLRERSRFPDPDAEAVEGGLVAPMPGKVLMVDVQPGDRVAAGQVLVLMEAMKMEHQITAPADGEVAEVRAHVGDQVDNGELLVVITAGDS
ncbi:MAG: ATP-grasp domain-containing protein [Acidimicrobiales bacterium]|nr:ATP-grasp domain-containing protein [Acidimicrobiales bacterium]MYB82468.1 ATP-grasp domain-containing protein [Acidimicrobiales bacterium]MYI11858.1 ATP-grasp domain-containing protein [Acidimicrobiales bacterium]